MKCDKCNNMAVMKMRQHHLALCQPHYIEWVLLQTQKAIEKYRMFRQDERILVAVSGGKDSLSLWDVLHRLGYQADGIYIDLGIEEEFSYSSESHQLALNFANERGLLLHTVSIKDVYGENIMEISRRTHRGQGRPCSVCGLGKRYIMNKHPLDNGYIILATGHNLDDEAAVLFGNVLAWSEELLPRQNPVLQEAPGFIRKVKPFCRLYERETAAYAIMENIHYIYDECPFSTGSKLLYYKDMLNRIEYEMPGTKLRFYLNYLKAKKTGMLNVQDQPGPAAEMIRCTNCGQPTNFPGLCAFCRLVLKKN